MKLQKKIRTPLLLLVASVVLGAAIGVLSSNVAMAEAQCADTLYNGHSCTNGSCNWHQGANAYECDYWGEGCGSNHPSCTGKPEGD